MANMDRSELRALQGPLKQQYRDDPAAAVAPAQASGSLEGPGVTCTVQTWAGEVRGGLHPATGGDGSDACSADMLLQALVACLGVTLRSVATSMGIQINSGSMVARSQFDARGTLAVDREAPVGLGPIEVEVALDTDADDEKLARLAELTERYCVVAHSLSSPTQLRIIRDVA
jgi:uncharacterized OsmC-like protein